MVESIIYKSSRVFIYSNNLSLQELLDHFTVTQRKIFTIMHGIWSMWPYLIYELNNR